MYFKGGYLDFSHLTELTKNIYHWNLYEKNNTNLQELRIIKLQKILFDGFSLKGVEASKVIFRFGARNNKKVLWEYPVANDG